MAHMMYFCWLAGHRQPDNRSSSTVMPDSADSSQQGQSASAERHGNCEERTPAGQRAFEEDEDIQQQLDWCLRQRLIAEVSVPRPLCCIYKSWQNNPAC